MVREFQQPQPYLARPSWPNEHGRVHPDQVLETNRYPMEAPVISSPPLGIEKALREQCKIPAQHYFVAVILDNGDRKFYTGPGHSRQDVPRFFNADMFAQCTKQGRAPGALSEETDVSLAEYTGGYGSHRQYEHSRSAASASTNNDGVRRRRIKRTFSQVSEEEVPGKVSQKKHIVIGDKQAVWDIYDQRFKNLQQTACKLVAKAWIKLVAPKKQSTHPYTGAEEKAPDWWPKPWGPTRDQAVRHKEPDHLYKRERVHLLIHILRIIVKPNAEQPSDIRKLGITVAKLEEATYEALSTFFSDPENPSNGKKKPYLREIFYIAKHEERYLNGEIDQNTHLYIMADDRLAEMCPSETEETLVAKEDEQEPASVSSSVSPQRNQHQQQVPATTGPVADNVPTAANLSGGSFMGELPHRAPPYAPAPLLHTDLGPETHGYMDANGMGGGHSGLPMQDMCAHPHDNSRRGSSSMFSTPTDFANTPTGTAMYPAWHHATTAPSNNTLYSFPAQGQQQASSHGHFTQPPPVPMAQPQAYLGPHFDGLQRAPFDSAQEQLFRTSTLHSQSYPMHHPGGGLKVEPGGRGRMH